MHLVAIDDDEALLWSGGAFRDWQQEHIDRADAARQSLSVEDYQRDLTRLLDRHYLRADTPQGGSGFGRSAEEWRDRREHVAHAIDHDGTFLDVGCANGFLAESVVGWCAERGVHVEAFGVDISPALVERARQRLPQWDDRFWVGDALTWTPPRRFDVVHALLDFVTREHRRRMIDNLLTWVEPGGRLVISHYGALERARDVVTDLGYEIDGEVGHGVWLRKAE